ncbi:MAG TPA: pyridoxal-phosphate dependent enzyme [Pseudonocardiaceae bacterium]|nr:pyridoxal-phosphate dependent enzyme [Pseudonocardiaceae bacterium]
MTPPRFPLAVLPTPLVRAHRLEAVLGRGPVLLKRDDLAGFAVGGNKTRPLEYLLGRALAERCDVLVTGGGPDSNFCPAAAVAARAAGLNCELVIWGDVRGSPNLAIAAAAGACIRPTGDEVREVLDDAIEARAVDLAAAGRRPFPVPRGGSTPLGAVGFAVAAAELAAQLDGEPALVVLAVGSGSSCAGLLAAGLPWPVLGVSVSRPLLEITGKVRALAEACAGLLGNPSPRPGRLEIVDVRGPGFGVASPADRAAARLALHTEGLLLDHTYGAKAFAVLTERVGGARGPVVFWHTGGLVPAVAALEGRT